MASSGHLLLQQSPLVEGRIKTLVNNDLRTICRAYGQIVSGTKIQLQQRCISILRGFVQKGDATEFNKFSGRVANHGQLPSTPTPATTTAQRVQDGHMTSRPSYTQSARPDFKNSPFYERLEIVVRPHDLPEMPQNRHTVRVDLVLNEGQVRLLHDNHQHYKIMVYCAQVSFGSYTSYDVAFPSQVEIKVNDDDVKANFKGLKNKPGSTKPADITRFVRVKAGYVNRMTVCYALTMKRFAFTTYLVRYVSTTTLVQKIRANRVFPKHKVLEEITRHNADPDVAAMATKMSLKDPVSTLRITVPIRSTVCSHNQCFDASFFLQLQEQAPTWQCPLCSKTVSFESLSVDKYFEEILQSTPQSTEQVIVEPDGEWKVVEEEEDKRPLGTAAKSVARAAYDDDFDDDDVVELSPETKPKVPIQHASTTVTSFSTPPASSREPSVAQSNSHTNQRASAVIDLTLSDDDEPIRPNKRARLIDPPPKTNPHTLTPTSYQEPPRALSQALPFDRHPSHGSNSFSAHSSGVNLQQTDSLSPFTTNAAPLATFGRSSDLGLPRPPSVNQPNNLSSAWAALRSPSLPFGESGELSRRLSSSASPSRWHDNGASNHEWRPPSVSSSNLPPQPRPPSFSSSYNGFAQDQPGMSPPARGVFSSNQSNPSNGGYTGGSSAPSDTA